MLQTHFIWITSHSSLGKPISVEYLLGSFRVPLTLQERLPWSALEKEKQYTCPGIISHSININCKSFTWNLLNHSTPFPSPTHSNLNPFPKVGYSRRTWNLEIFFDENSMIRASARKVYLQETGRKLHQSKTTPATFGLQSVNSIEFK